MAIPSAFWTDAHCHLQDPCLKDGINQLLDRASTFGIRGFIVNATSEDDWDAVAHLALQHTESIFPQFGIHPWKAAEVSDGWTDRLQQRLIVSPDAGVGETGLDSKLTDIPMDKQQPVFQAQLETAARLDRCCTVHLIGAWADFHATLKKVDLPRILLHSFNGSAEQVEGFSDSPIWFSFGGAVIKHRNSQKLKDAVRAVPREKLLLETDSPFQHPVGKEHTQEPAGLIRIADEIARLRGLTVDALRKQTQDNLRDWLGTNPVP